MSCKATRPLVSRQDTAFIVGSSVNFGINTSLIGLNSDFADGNNSGIGYNNGNGLDPNANGTGLIGTGAFDSNGNLTGNLNLNSNIGGGTFDENGNFIINNPNANSMGGGSSASNPNATGFLPRNILSSDDNTFNSFGAKRALELASNKINNESLSPTDNDIGLFDEYLSQDNVYSALGTTPDVIDSISRDAMRILPYLDLDKYPTLKDKVNNGSGYLNPFDIAEMMNIVGYNPNDVYDMLKNQPSDRNSIGSDVDDFFGQLDFYNNNFLSAVNETSKCDSLYKIWQALVKIELLIVSAQNFIARLKQFSIKDLIGKLVSIADLAEKFMKELAERIISRLRKLAAKVIAKIEGFVNSVRSLVKTINKKMKEMEEFFTGDNMKKMAADLKQQLKELTSPLSLAGSIVGILSTIAYVIWRLCKLIESIKNLFTGPLNSFQDLVSRITRAQILVEAMDFKRASAAAENGALRLAPNVVDSIKQELTRKVNSLNPLLTYTPTNSIVGEFLQLQNISNNVRIVTGGYAADSIKTSVDNIIQGQVEIYTRQAQIRGENALSGNAGSVSDPTGSPPPIPPLVPYVAEGITSEETQWVMSIDENYNDEFNFASSVKNMHKRVESDMKQYKGQTSQAAKDRFAVYNDGHNYEGAGWKHVQRSHPDVFISLRRVVNRMRSHFGKNYNFTINSAFRNAYYNRFIVGGATRSMHMSAMALDVSITNTGAGALSLDEQNVFGYFAASEGFQGLGLYRSFIHIDKRSSVVTWKGSKNSAPSAEQLRKVWPNFDAYESTGKYPNLTPPR
jgi:uncharacterized protein YcbK (DUF882 family)